MGFRANAFATVWSIEETNSPNVTKVRLATSKKNKKTGEWEQDFGGFCRFIGEANKNVAKLKEKDRIKILECEVTNNYNKEAKREFVDYTVFSFEMADGSSAATKKAVDDPVEGDTDNFPF